MSVYVTKTAFIFPITLVVVEEIPSKSNAYGFQANKFLKELDNEQFGTLFHGHLQTTEVKSKHLLKCQGLAFAEGQTSCINSILSCHDNTDTISQDSRNVKRI